MASDYEMASDPFSGPAMMGRDIESRFRRRLPGLGPGLPEAV